MSNFYAKAINPRTNKLEKAVVLDMGKDNFIQFEDGWKHNLKFFKGDVITEDEQEAINKDGEEIMEQWDNIYNLNPDAYDKAMKTREAFEDEGYPNFFDYSFNWKWRFIFWLLALGFLTVLVSGVVTLITFTMKLLGV